MTDDLRDWLEKVEAIGKLKTVDGADWDLEIGAASALNQRRPDCPALLFDNIKGYPRGYRVVTCTGATARLVAVTLGLPATGSDRQLMDMLLEKLPQWESSLERFPPQAVSAGPVLENVLSGKDVDLFRFPVPKWYPLDGGRYIGTGHVVITRDRDTGEVNLGTYRLQALDRRTTGWFMLSPGQHGDIHRRKYHAKGERCPVAVSVGHHPLIFRSGSIELPVGREYHFAGAVMGHMWRGPVASQPVRVVIEELTGLPIPADSEIVLAGWCPPDVYRTEGPFGEWTGYYGDQGERPVIEVERLYFRNDPILVGSMHDRPHLSYFWNLYHSVMLHRELSRSGVPGVKGVWMGTPGGPMVAVVSIAQQYAGHGKDVAALVARSKLFAMQARGKYVVIVDDDIDPTNTAEVMWAVGTRSHPNEISFVQSDARTASMLPRDAKSARDSKAVILACKPFDWINEFPKSLEVTPEVAETVRKKWPDLLP